MGVLTGGNMRDRPPRLYFRFLVQQKAIGLHMICVFLDNMFFSFDRQLLFKKTKNIDILI